MTNFISKLYSKWKGLMEAIYAYANKVSAKKNATWILAAISFVESSFFPIPPDIFLIPIVLNKREHYLRIAGVCTIASVLGGILGYFIGLLLFDMVALPILQLYNYMAVFDQFKTSYNEYGAWIVFFAGLTPFPYKVITISSGAVEMNLFIFTVASVLSRGARFYLVSWLVYKLGPKAQVLIEKHLGWLSILFFVLLFGSFLLIKLL